MRPSLRRARTARKSGLNGSLADMATFLALALVCAPQSPAASPPVDTRPPIDVAALLEPIRSEADVPGIVAAIVTRDGLQFAGASGLRRRGNTTPITVEDQMHLGSCTKSMTATLCAVLVQKEKLRWDARVGEAFASVVPELHESWSRVTLADLLVNRGGVPGDIEPVLWSLLWKSDLTPAEGRRLLARGILRAGPIAAPGAKYVYSNAGFALAGTMAERAAEKPWEELITAELFEPLGMTTVGFGAPGGKTALTQPRGHRENGEPVEPTDDADNPGAIGPAGRVHCSVPDWAKYIALHLRGEQQGGLGLTSDAFVRLHAPVKSSKDKDKYAMGWSVTERSWGGRVLTHNGSNTLWFCVAWLAPDKGFAVIAATNQGGDKAAKACDQASASLLRAWREREDLPK
jgi:CubicO group peptidase (beta-lactamase class C family)